jgi:hypothetical protein
MNPETPISTYFMTAGGDPLQDLIAQMKSGMSDPNSSLYLPRIVFGQVPPYDPFVPGTPWDLNITGDPGTFIANTVCGDVGSEGAGEIWIGTPGQFPNINLKNIKVTGIANAQLTNQAGNPNGAYNGQGGADINAQISFCSLPESQIPVVIGGVTKQCTIQTTIKIDADFYFQQSCCQQDISKPGNVCLAGTTTNQAAPGHATMVVTGAVAAVVMTATFQQQVPKLLLSVTPPLLTQVTWADPIIRIDLDPPDPDWNKAASTAFSSPGTQSAMVAQINAEFSAPATLAQFAAQLQATLNAYLEQSGQYPYGPASVAAF